MFHLSIGGDKPTKAPRGDGTVTNTEIIRSKFPRLQPWTSTTQRGRSPVHLRFP